MGWSIGVGKDGRDIGYGVPALCDHPNCTVRIDRGLSYVCGMINTEGEDRGCGLHFCATHLLYSAKFGQLCQRCWPKLKKSFTRKPDLFEWELHKRTHPSWAEWRNENNIPEPEKTMDFNNLREILETIRIGVGGGIVSASWNGELMQVVHSRPELKSGKYPFNMVFDTESDYEPERMSELIKLFAVESKKYYEAT